MFLCCCHLTIGVLEVSYYLDGRCFREAVGMVREVLDELCIYGFDKLFFQQLIGVFT